MDTLLTYIKNSNPSYFDWTYLPEMYLSSVIFLPKTSCGALGSHASQTVCKLSVLTIGILSHQQCRAVRKSCTIYLRIVGNAKGS